MAAVALAAVQCDFCGHTSLSSEVGQDFLGDLLYEVKEERERQEKKWGTQTHNRDRWHTILGEEVGEVARAILEGK